MGKISYSGSCQFYAYPVRFTRFFPVQIVYRIFVVVFIFELVFDHCGIDEIFSALYLCILAENILLVKIPFPVPKEATSHEIPVDRCSLHHHGNPVSPYCAGICRHADDLGRPGPRR